jgi:hypothetical protein
MLENARDGPPPSGAAPFQYLEDAIGASVDDLAPLDDGALKRGGLAAVQAYVRTRQTVAARRCARHRERQKLAGREQLNVTVPANDATRAAVKSLGRALSAGTVSAPEIIALVERRVGGSTEAPPGPAPTSMAPDPHGADLARLRQVLARGGLRATLVRWLAGGSGHRFTRQGPTWI